MKTITYQYAHFVNSAGQTVISARSTYAGKTVKGYAKCDPRDTFDAVKGEKLAAARCNKRIARKRLLSANAKVDAARKALAEAQARLDKMLNFQADATHRASAAEDELANVLKEIG